MPPKKDSTAPANPTATSSLNLDELPPMVTRPRSPLRALLDDYLDWSSQKKHDIVFFTTVDVTVFVALEKQCRAQRKRPPSLVAYFVRCLGVTLEASPYMVAAPLGRGVYIPQDINVSMMVSALTPTGDPLPMVMELLKVNTTSLPEIGENIATRSRALRREGLNNSTALEKAAWLGRRSPRVRRLLYGLCNLNPRFRKYLTHYTTFVGLTSVTQYTGGRSGWGLPILPHTLAVAMGGLSRRPLVVGDEILVRDCLDLTFVWDHSMIDGAPGLEWINKFCAEVESGRLLAEFEAG